MMTDKETIVEMLTRAKIAFEEDELTFKKGKTSITVERGYAGFCSVFEFNPDGSLKDLGAWE